MNKKMSFLLLLSLFLVLLLFPACGRKQETPPKQVVGGYLKCLVKQDYKEAYSLCSKRFRSKVTLDDFALVSKRLRLQGIDYFSPKVEEAKVIGEEAVVRYRLGVKGGPMGGRRTFKGSARLIMEDNKWKIEKIVGMPKE